MNDEKPRHEPSGELYPDLPKLVSDTLRATFRQVRRLVIFVIGITVLLIGVVMFFTPGPAVLVIPIGLGILAIEFAWARLALRRFRQRAEKLGSEVARRFRREQEGREPPP